MSLEHSLDREVINDPKSPRPDAIARGPPARIVRKPEACALTGLSPTSIWRKERAGQFPKRRRLGPNAVGWLLSDILEWIENCEEVA